MGGRPTVAVDARTFLAARPLGEGKTLGRLYQEIALQRPDWRIVLYGQDGSAPRPVGTANAEARYFDLRGHRINSWEQIGLPYRAWADRARVLHCTSSSMPFFSLVPRVLTVHDAIPVVMGDGWSSQAVTRFRRGLARALHAAAAIIAVSESTKRDLVSLFDLGSAKIHVIHWGCDVPSSEPLRAKQSSGNARRYVLGFGGAAPRKNVERLIRAFSRLKGFHDIDLVLVGVGGELARRRFAAVAGEVDSHARVRLLGYVQEAELEELYRNAACLAYVSLYEGFGMPVLEAMARGVPVVTSDVSSLPEVAGDAAILVDPSSCDAIAAGLREILSGAAADLIARGMARARTFSWSVTARKTAAVLESVMDGG